MSIVSLKKIAAGRSGDQKSDYNRSYTVVWTAIVNDPKDGPRTLGLASGLPLLFSSYIGYENASDIQALCTGVKPEQDGDEWQKWKITATFETNFKQEQQQQENPTKRPVTRWVEYENQSKKVTKEWDGTEIKNSAGQLLDGLERQDCVRIDVFQRYESPDNSANWDAYQNTTNSKQFEDIPKNQGLMQVTAAPPDTINGFYVSQVTYRIKRNPEGWDIEPADRGREGRGCQILPLFLRRFWGPSRSAPSVDGPRQPTGHARTRLQ